VTARVACAARGDPRLGLGGDVLDSIVHARGDGFIAERRWHVSDACGVGVPVGCGKFGSGVRTIESAVGAVGFGKGGKDWDRSLGVDFVHRLLLARPHHVRPGGFPHVGRTRFGSDRSCATLRRIGVDPIRRIVADALLNSTSPPVRRLPGHGAAPGRTRGVEFRSTSSIAATPGWRIHAGVKNPLRR
jgi:hypothetical protein